MAATPRDLTPQNLTATPGDEGAELRWNAFPDTTYRITATAGNTEASQTYTAKASPYTMAGLINGTEYSIRMHAEKTGYKPSALSDVMTTTPFTPAPTNLSGEPILEGVRLAWQSTAKNAAFVVHYATVSFEGKDISEYDELTNYGTQQATVTTADIQNLTPNQTYYFVVVATKSGEHTDSAPSSQATAIPSDKIPTDKPEGVSATVGNGVVTLQWNAVNLPGTINYTIYQNDRSIATTTALTYTVSDLANGQSYTFHITAHKDDPGYAESEKSATVSATPLNLTPTGLIATGDNGAVELRWDAPGVGEEYSEIAYTVYQDTQSIQSTASLEGVTMAANSTRITGLVNKTAYYFVVTANKATYAESGLSNQVDATPDNITPQGVTATAGNQRVRLDWATIAGASTYTVYYEHNGTAITKTTQTNSFIATNLDNRTLYAFSVTADKDGFKQSAKSAEVSATPLNLTPQGLSVIADNQQAHLSWAASTDAANTAGVTYTVFQDGQPVLGATDIQGSTHTVSDLTNGDEYTFTVRADKDGYEQSTASNAATVIPLDLTPQNFTATADNRTVRLAWDRVAGASAYTVYQTVNGNTTTDTVNVNTFTANNLINGTEYAFAVTAHALGYKESAKSAEQIATPFTPAPTNLAFVGGEGSIIGVWDAVEGATTYEVRYQKGGGTTQTQESSTNSITIPDLDVGQAYYITVITKITGHADSASSVEVSAVPQQHPPADTPHQCKCHRTPRGHHHLLARRCGFAIHHSSIQRTAHGQSQ